VETDNEKPIVIYHGGCDDGFGAAWAIWCAHAGWEFVPAAYGAPPPEVAGRDVVMADFSYKRPVLEAMAREAHSILILDHHESAAEELAAPFEDAAFCPVRCVFDMDHSGAMLAWREYHPGAEPPALLRHIEDRDLWRFALPNTQEVTMALRSYGQEFLVWNWLMGRDIEELVSEGRICQRFFRRQWEEGLIGKWMRNPTYARIGVARVPVINATSHFYSEVAGALAEQDGVPFAACFSHNHRGVTYSLRSREGGANVARIAQEYGGGGHAHAAGFTVPSPLLMDVGDG
jgi:oligoribonuclease NrnB/cAMP/cGMP phosphodiesterase (DHH superfamily)